VGEYLKIGGRIFKYRVTQKKGNF